MSSKKGTKENAVADDLPFSLEYYVSLEPGPNNGQPASKSTLDVHRIGKRFTTVLQALWKYIHGIGEVAEATSFTNFLRLTAVLPDISERMRLAKAGEAPIARLTVIFKEKQKGAEKKEGTWPIFERDHLRRIREIQQHHNVALTILNETAIQQIVNTYERLVADLLEWRLLANPQSIPKDRTIAYREVLSLQTLEDVKRSIIDREIESFLKGKSAEEQIKHFQTQFDVDVAAQFPSLPKFKELILRRHIIVHAGGIVTGEYIRRASRLGKGVIDPSEIVEGKPVPVSPKYVKAAWCLTYAFGIVLLHMVAQECARSTKSTELKENVDGMLNDAAYTAILNKQYSAAQEILEYAIKRHFSSSTQALMARLNLAQCKKWQGKEEECNKLLDGHDWDATSSDFRLCVAALRDQYDEFKRLLRIVAEEKKITDAELYQWPVFQTIREKPDFEQCVGAAFGSTKRPSLLDFDPKVFDPHPEITIAEFSKYFDSISKKNVRSKPADSEHEQRDKDSKGDHDRNSSSSQDSLVEPKASLPMKGKHKSSGRRGKR